MTAAGRRPFLTWILSLFEAAVWGRAEISNKTEGAMGGGSGADATIRGYSSILF